MKVKIDKLSDNENTFKTELPFTGEAPFEPTVNQSFMVTGGEFGGFITSTVLNVEQNENGWILKTRNSTYQVEKVSE